MASGHAKVIRGMSIACIALSGLCLLGFFIGALGCLFSAGIVSSEAQFSGTFGNYYGDLSELYGLEGLGEHGDLLGYGSAYSAGQTTAEVVAGIIRICAVLFLVFAVLQAVSLAASVIALVKGKEPQSLGFVFGWSLAGAIANFLSSGIPQLVMFVLIAVFVYKDKQLYANSGYSTVSPYEKLK